MRFLLIIFLLAACGGKDHESTGVDPENFFAVIYGQVVAEEGAPVANAQVRGTSFKFCGDSVAVGAGTTRTSSTGSYSLRVTYPDAGVHCVRVLVTPPSLNLLPDSVDIDEVRFARVPADSIRQDLTLRLPGGPGGPPGVRPITKIVEE